ncbi:alpha/beta hydrolase [Salana multivorans]
MTQRSDEEWRPDLLGGEITARTIPLAADRAAAATPDADPPVATLVRLAPPRHRRAYLYVHGFSDYFFQVAWATEVAAATSADFYAVDLRRYGRSLRPGQIPGDVRDLADYDEELLAALEIVRAEGHDEVILLAHSTGGLIAPLFLSRYRRGIQGLVLNSPWFDVNDSALKRIASGPLARSVALRDPLRIVSRLEPGYTESIHVTRGGEFDFDLVWKPFDSFPVRAAWLAAIRRGHRELQRGLRLGLPILMCTSSRSGGTRGRPARPNDHATSDTVLDVAHMWRGVPELGRNVTLHTIPGGRHDLALSAGPARSHYAHAVIDWIAWTFDRANDDDA